MKKLKKILAVVLAAVVMMTVMPVTQVFAQESIQALTLDTLKSVTVNGEEVMLSFTPEKDGHYKFVSTGSHDTYATLYDSEYNEISRNDDDRKSCNFEIVESLVAGNIYYLGVNAWDVSSKGIKFRVKVTECDGIESVTVIKYPDDMTCIEGYENSSASLKGLELLFVTSKGDEISWSLGQPPYIGDYMLTDETYFSEDGYYCMVLECGGQTIELKYEIVENPVDRIEYHSKKDIVLYENTGGYNYDGIYIYDYKLPSDAYFTIYYKDGRSVECKEDDYIDSMYVRVYSDQWDDPWSVGTNYVYVTYMGVETPIPVYVKGCEFKSVTVNRVPGREYIFGDSKYGYLDERNRYVLIASDISGLSFTVEYMDGRKEVFSDADFDVENGTIAGLPYEVDECATVIPKTNQVTLHFMGAEIKYNIKVVESPLQNIEMTWYPELTDYEDRYIPVFDGAEFTLTFKDGTQKVVVVSDENTSFGNGKFIHYEVAVDDYTIQIHELYYDNGDRCYIFDCLGKWVEYDGIWYDESREIASIEVEKFVPDVEGMVLNVEYTDGSADTLTYHVVGRTDTEDSAFVGYAKTEKGIVSCRVDEITDNGKIIGYEVYTLDERLKVMGSVVNIGDADGDGDVTIMDVTAVQRHIAEDKTLSGTALEAADVDKDGVIAIIDATIIQRYIAKEIEKF